MKNNRDEKTKKTGRTSRTSQSTNIFLALHRSDGVNPIIVGRHPTTIRMEQLSVDWLVGYGSLNE
jgi:hypothetical protein